MHQKTTLDDLFFQAGFSGGPAKKRVLSSGASGTNLVKRLVMLLFILFEKIKQPTMINVQHFENKR